MRQGRAYKQGLGAVRVLEQSLVGKTIAGNFGISATAP